MLVGMRVIESGHTKRYCSLSLERDNLIQQPLSLNQQFFKDMNISHLVRFYTTVVSTQ